MSELLLIFALLRNKGFERILLGFRSVTQRYWYDKMTMCSHPSAYFFSLFFWVRWGVGVSVCPPVTQIWNTGRNLQQMTLKSIKYLSFLESIYLTHFCHFFELVLFNVGFHFLFCFWSLMFKGRSTYRSSCFGFSATWFFCSFCCCS